MDLDTSLVIQMGALGVVGVVTSVKVLVSYIKKLLGLEGQQVMWLTLFMSGYVVVTALMATEYPVMSLVFTGIYTTVLVAAMADAFFQQEEELRRDRGND